MAKSETTNQNKFSSHGVKQFLVKVPNAQLCNSKIKSVRAKTRRVGALNAPPPPPPPDGIGLTVIKAHNNFRIYKQLSRGNQCGLEEKNYFSP